MDLPLRHKALIYMCETKPPHSRCKCHEDIDMYVRKLVRFDERQLSAHYKRLDGDDRRLRFFSAVSDDFLDAYAAKVVSLRRWCLGGFVDGQLRAVGELAFDAAYPSRLCAEIALSVEDGHRGQGAGGTLLDALITVARNRGVRDIAVPCLPDNHRMRRLIAKFEGRGLIAGGVYDAHIALPPPDMLSGWTEAVRGLSSAHERWLAGWSAAAALRAA